MLVRKVICALDMSDVEEALAITRRLSSSVGAFKVGHALSLPNGLSIVDRLRGAGANRVFLDLKFHDIPNSVALAVREASRYGVWAMTLHVTGGPAMLTAAVEEARLHGEDVAPLLIGVTVLTSIDEHMLSTHLGVERPLEQHTADLARMAMDHGLDGIVCSAQEAAAMRQTIGHEGVIVCPGIRPAVGESHDQRRTGTAMQALEDGADYLVIGRALIDSPDAEAALEAMGFEGVKGAG